MSVYTYIHSLPVLATLHCCTYFVSMWFIDLSAYDHGIYKRICGWYITVVTIWIYVYICIYMYIYVYFSEKRADT